MDQNNGLEAKISIEEIRTLLTIDLGEVPLMPTRVSLLDATLHIGTTLRMIEDHVTNAQINRSIEAMETDDEMDLSTFRMGIGETKEIFLVLHRSKGGISHKIAYTANHKLINLTTLRSADLTIDLRLALRLMNRSVRRTIIRRHLIWFVSPQPMIP